MRHVEFCLTEIECEIEADAGFLDLDARLALGVHIAGMREVLSSRRRASLDALLRCEPVIIGDVLLTPAARAEAVVTAPVSAPADQASHRSSEPTTSTSDENTPGDGFDASAAAALAAAVLLASPAVVAVPGTAEPAPISTGDAALARPEPVALIITPPIPAQPKVRPPVAAKPKVVSRPPALAAAAPVVATPVRAEIVALPITRVSRRAPRLPYQRIAAALAIVAVLGVIGAPRFTEVQAAAWQSVAAAQARLVLW